jgi:hypothetical protein
MPDRVFPALPASPRAWFRGPRLTAARRYAHVAACLVALAATPQPAFADPWAAPGDARLRHDLQLLADAGIVRAPLTAWPVSWGEIARDLAAVPDAASLPPHLARAFTRVKRATGAGGPGFEARVSGSAEPPRLRRFSDAPREEGEIEGALQYAGEVFAARLQATAVADPDDDEPVRPDGSYVAAVMGNWMLSAGWIDRWWGPGWEGSLILGTNQRPIPALTLERNYSDPFESRWLAWLGQWRLAIGYGLLDDEREDYPNAHFFSMRLTWKPHDRVEIGLSRTAQLCGDGRDCGWSTFWDMFTGNDNDQALADQPGNQLAGIDLRWSLPWLPVALYGQAIGEDEANAMPSQYLGLVGAEVWGGAGEAAWRVHAEYSDTTCGFYDSAPQYGCAYRSAVYTDGYQYLHRSIGHPTDGDSRQWAVGATWVSGDGSSWQVAAQDAKLNREGANPVHTLSPVPMRLRSVDVEHRRDWLGGDLELGVGYEQRESSEAGIDDGDLRATVQWALRFE